MIDESLAVSVFISYSHKDERFKESLEEHLAVLLRAGKISHWCDRKIVPGTSWTTDIDRNIEQADVILLLLSPSFIASGYCYEKELALALTRHEAESAVVIPVFVRPVDLTDEPIMTIQGLPKDAVSVSEWPNEDLAWRDVSRGLRKVVDELLERKSRRHEPVEMASLQETLSEMVDGINERYQSDNIGGISYGLVDLDRVTDGLHRGQLVTLAARPEMGLTDLSLSVCASVAEIGLPVLIFSTKTARVEVMKRLVSIIGRIAHHRFQQGRLTDADWVGMTHSVKLLSDAQIMFDDSTELDLDALRSRCLSAKTKLGNLGLVVIDSVSYMTASTHAGPREEVIARGLKALARELNCAVLVTAPVSRVVESRPNKRPITADLKSWHELADESDVVMFVYRDEFYNWDSSDRGAAELIVAKNQFGSVGPLRVSYKPEFGLFTNFAGSQSDEPDYGKPGADANRR
ncbi:TIR domain-containing protein [Caballeronia sp. EK]|uniref:DnaB-like helicase C-terminal domain-containing protein n=1 Tax=Caballeronia sp. EK TaxID=2767469 RepID=UPI001655B0A5|nr:DnaB-like helicase C-terminal domain-containing protein [Caballeronia sp. EK]MBC8642916.1 TIR domain-containing protein [Caballeronia sp. EK]